MATGAVPISIGSTVDIGYGRGRLAPNPAASLRRIDSQLGRLADVNDAWRFPEVADENRRKWLAYKAGTGPIAPYALDRWGSIHCRGYAADSDDWYNAAAAAVWWRNGWRQTARYSDSRDEPWHGEYDEVLDQYLGTTAVGGASPFPDPSTSGGSEMYIIRAEGRAPTLVGPGYVRSLNDEEAGNIGAIVSKDTTVNARQFDLAVSAATSGVVTAPPRLGDETTVIHAPNRPFALVAPGFYRELNDEERQNVALFTGGRGAVEGNDRQFDLWRSIALSGQVPAPPIVDPKPTTPPAADLPKA